MTRDYLGRATGIGGVSDLYVQNPHESTVAQPLGPAESGIFPLPSIGLLERDFLQEHPTWRSVARFLARIGWLGVMEGNATPTATVTAPVKVDSGVFGRPVLMFPPGESPKKANPSAGGAQAREGAYGFGSLINRLYNCEPVADSADRRPAIADAFAGLPAKAGFDSPDMAHNYFMRKLDAEAERQGVEVRYVDRAVIKTGASGYRDGNVVYLDRNLRGADLRAVYAHELLVEDHSERVHRNEHNRVARLMEKLGDTRASAAMRRDARMAYSLN